eukprot:scaffold86741_cov38-Prasinocladus_malaysianus.AAC.2
MTEPRGNAWVEYDSRGGPEAAAARTASATAKDLSCLHQPNTMTYAFVCSAGAQCQQNARRSAQRAPELCSMVSQREALAISSKCIVSKRCSSGIASVLRGNVFCTVAAPKSRVARGPGAGEVPRGNTGESWRPMNNSMGIPPVRALLVSPSIDCCWAWQARSPTRHQMRRGESAKGQRVSALDGKRSYVIAAPQKKTNTEKALSKRQRKAEERDKAVRESAFDRHMRREFNAPDRTVEQNPLIHGNSKLSASNPLLDD